MKYYFKIINDKIDSSYAYSEEEIKLTYPNLDLTKDIPSDYIEFKPSTLPRRLGPYEKINFLGYEFISDNLVTDKKEIVSMSEEEKILKQEKTKTDFYNQTKYYSWVLNVSNCAMEAPYPPPQDGWQYKWNEETKTFAKVNSRRVGFV